jgi:hypothetical protein
MHGVSGILSMFSGPRLRGTAGMIALYSPPACLFVFRTLPVVVLRDHEANLNFPVSELLPSPSTSLSVFEWVIETEGNVF